MAVLTVQEVSIDGITPSYAAAAAGGDEFPNTGREILHVKNGSAGSITVTITTPQEIDGVAIADPAVVIVAGAEAVIGPFQPRIFNASDGNVDVGYSAAASVTVGVFQVD